jgi:class 3 adenylate cyclase
MPPGTAIRGVNCWGLKTWVFPGCPSLWGPETVVNYTTQTGEPLVLEYAYLQAPFNADPFVRQHRSRSILCIPFAHHGKIAGLLYLSNDLVEGAFTADRVALLSLMGGQMGVSIARYYEGVSVLFADIKDFTLLAERLHATELVQELDYCFRAFDAILGRHRVEKIKTIGDAYFCAAGLPVPYEDHAVELVYAALAMQAWMREESIRRQKEGQSWFELRIGIHSGPVIAGVVGASKFAYDIWGDTVNVAARMEQSSEPGKINISEHTYAMVKGHFSCAFRGAVEVKNKGSLNMYFKDSVL